MMNFPMWQTEEEKASVAPAKAMFADADADDDETVQCPNCGCREVHPVMVEVNRGGELLFVDFAGEKRKSGRALGRGAAIDLGFTCERHHRFTLRFHFHKGNTSALVHSVDDFAVGPKYDSECYYETLWRD